MSVAKIITLIVVAALAGFVQPGFALSAERPLPEVEPGLYEVTPPPLQPVECGQCHVGQFADLKQAGGKHRFACQECHEVFHAYNPRKDNYDALMPECAACHKIPHGPKQVDCLNCHQNPHAPLRVPAMSRLEDACTDCHAGPAREMTKFPSAHAEESCQSCHYEKHGFLPSCFDCHDGHYDGQAETACMTCHDRVHAPLQIGFPGDAEVRNCSGCHDAVYAKWRDTASRHGEVLCVMCHRQHGQIPDCRECHAQPHNPKQLAMFPDCLTCHLDVHDLPVKQAK